MHMIPAIGMYEGMLNVATSVGADCALATEFVVADICGPLCVDLSSYSLDDARRIASEITGGITAGPISMTARSASSAISSDGNLMKMAGEIILMGALPGYSMGTSNVQPYDCAGHGMSLDTDTRNDAAPHGAMKMAEGNGGDKGNAASPSKTDFKEVLQQIDAGTLVRRYGGRMLEIEAESAREGHAGRNGYLNLRIPTAEKEMALQTAEKLGLSMTQFTRLALHLLMEILRNSDGQE